MKSASPEPVFELKSLHWRITHHVMLVSVSLGGQSRNLRIPICRETYEGISGVIPTHESGVHYRLSLRYLWDPFRQQHFSSITRVSLNNRELRYFPCPSSFGDVLLQLQRVQDLEDLDSVSFVHPQIKSATRAVQNIQAPAPTVFVVCLLVGLLSIAAGLHALPGAGSIGMFAESSIGEAAAVERTLDGEERTAAVAHPRRTPESRKLATLLQPGEHNLGTEQVLSGKADANQEDNTEDEEKDSCRTITLKPGERLYCLPEGYVALTFDDGPTPYTRAIVDILKEYDIPGTFFFVGKHVHAFPGAVEHAEAGGMTLGNHSYSHINLLGAGPERLREEILNTNEILSSFSDRPVKLFRPPFGLMNEEVEAVLIEEHMKTVMWCYDARDWEAQSKREVLDYVVEDTDPCGGIYLFHENALVVQALPAIIEYFDQQGLTFVVFE